MAHSPPSSTKGIAYPPSNGAAQSACSASISLTVAVAVAMA